MADIENDIVHLARLVAEDRNTDVAALLRRLLRTVAQRRPDLADEANRASLVFAGSLARGTRIDPLPVDADSRLELLRKEARPEIPERLVWSPEVLQQLSAVVKERQNQAALEGAGLPPSRSLLFVGPPGVGKTVAARWLANELKRPLLTLDLAAVMSSFLGKTGSNIRSVLQYAQKEPSVLLLDEFDAIAKRRDDAAEIGELKRLVTVLVQAIDDWPMSGVLIAATNHPELLDPAVWRRFDRIVEFPFANTEQVAELLEFFVDESTKRDSALVHSISAALQGASFADIIQNIQRARRDAILKGGDWTTALSGLSTKMASNAPLKTKLNIAGALQAAGHSQRTISQVTGLSRDTIRKYSKKASGRKTAGRH